MFERVIDPPEPLSTTWFRLEAWRPEHNERDYEAWMSSIEHITQRRGLGRTRKVTTGRRR